MSIVKRAYERREIYVESDGFYVWASGRGYLTADHLRALADELDRLNKPYEEQLNLDLLKLAAMQQPLGEEFEKVLYDNLDKLYVTDDDHDPVE